MRYKFGTTLAQIPKRNRQAIAEPVSQITSGSWPKTKGASPCPLFRESLLRKTCERRNRFVPNDTAGRFGQVHVEPLLHAAETDRAGSAGMPFRTDPFEPRLVNSSTG